MKLRLIKRLKYTVFGSFLTENEFVVRIDTIFAPCCDRNKDVEGEVIKNRPVPEGNVNVLHNATTSFSTVV